MSDTKTARLYLHALTPVQSGVGGSAGIVDLPIAREKATGWPVIPGSSIKGVLRDRADEETANTLFGRPPKDGDQGEAGRIALSDMRILCLPVRSFYGTFAWVTSPLALTRFVRDAKAIGGIPLINMDLSLADSDVIVAEDSAVCKSGKMYLEDLDFNAKSDPRVGDIADAIGKEAGLEGMRLRLAVVPDTVFSFLCETATEIAARVGLEEKSKTVKPGALWWEEAVPAETLFYGWAMEARRNKPAMEEFVSLANANECVSIGGHTSVGRGLCRLAVAR